MTKTIVYASAFALLVGAGYLSAPTPAHAADAGTAYSSINRSNDLGNDTGDSQVDRLNSIQLSEHYHGRLEQRAPAADSSLRANPSLAMAPQSGEPAPPPSSQMSPH